MVPLVGLIIPSLLHDGRAYINMSPANLVECGVPEAAALDAVKPLLKAAVDAAAEVARLGIITGGVGQAMEYSEADAEAREVMSAAPDTIKPERFPMLTASIGLDIDPSTGAPAVDVLGVARSVLTARDAWVPAGAAIRKVRLAAKAAIAAAQTFEAAGAALASVVWPSAG